MFNNGIKYTELLRDFTNTFSLSILIDGGLYFENEKNSGIGNLTAIVWVKSNKILENAEFYGGKIGAKLTANAFEISFAAPKDVADKLIADFEEFLLRPKFSTEIFEREKAVYLQELEASRDNPNYLASEGFRKVAYAGTPYAKSVDGTIQTVKNLTLKDVENYYKENLHGLRTVVSLVGNFSDDFSNRIKSIVSKIPKGKEFEIDCKNSEIKKSIRKEETDSRIKQAKLFIAYNAPEVSSKDYSAVKVLNELLGGRMSSRYFEEIRKNSGYAYSVYSIYPSKKCTSRFVVSIGLDYKNADSAIKKIEEINLNLASTITDDETEKSKNALLGSSLMESQTNESLSWYRGFFTLMGLGADYYDKYVSTLEKITKKDLINTLNIFKGEKVVYILKPQSE